MTARQDSSGGLLLLEEQDRTLWDQKGIQVGLEWLAKSAQGDGFSRDQGSSRPLAPRGIVARRIGSFWQ